MRSHSRAGNRAFDLFEQLEPRQMLSTFMVENNNDAGAGSLREAILSANSAAGADVIEFSGLGSGVITLTSGELEVTDDLSIVGPGAASLIISGNNVTRVLHFSSGVSSLSGLSITRGRVAGSLGGGIYNQGTLTITDSTISANTVSYVFPDGICHGGGIYNSGTLTVAHSTISGNLIHNIGVDTDYGESLLHGGGIYNGGTLTISNSTISENTTTRGTGGGIYNHADGTLTIIDSTISGNTAVDTNDGGGGIYNGGTLTITNSTVSGNTGAGFGSVGGLGGGICNSGTLTITSSTISGNRASRGSGGGIYNPAGGVLTVTSSTITANTGTGVSVYNLAAWTLRSSIVAGNVGRDVDGGFLAPGSTNNLVGVDAKLGLLADNGGPTMTHAPQTGSPAINAGSNPLNLVNDQRGTGFARLRGAGIDIGAIEYLEPPAEQFIALFEQSAVGGSVDGNWIADNLLTSVPNVASSNAYWGARNHWFQDNDGDVWALWHGGDAHRSVTLPGQHRWVLTNLTEGAGLSGAMHLSPGSISGITTGWNAFNIQGVQDGKLWALWWSPEGSGGTYVDQQGRTLQGRHLGNRGNGWVFTSISEAAVVIGQAASEPPPTFLPYTESQGNGRTEFDPRPTPLIYNSGMSVVAVDSSHRVFVCSFNIWQQEIAGARLDLNGVWVFELLEDVPSIDAFGLHAPAFADAYVTAAIG